MGRENVAKILAGALVVAALVLPLLAQAEEPGALAELSLEELMGLEVTSVSKKPQERMTAAAALYVITGDDIRRSGARSIPEALRLAPGVQVARIDSNKWAVGVRGFASRLARSVLVLIDGRSVYTPLFAGTYWEVQDTLLEDIDRIEVIRGPGGTLWGANAFNGVINIITRDARTTQGGYATVGGGNEEQGFAGVRYGGRIGDGPHYRVYGKFFNRDGFFNPNGSSYDDWYMGRGGFRMDWDVGERDAITLQGDAYAGEAGHRTTLVSFDEPFTTVVERDADLAGANLLGRWRRILGAESDLSLQAYYDQTYRREPNFREGRHTGDLEFQHRLGLPANQELIWGLNYRVSADDTSSIPTIAFIPSGRTVHLFSGFVQDEIRLLDARLHLIFGSKFEHNDFSGFELQPNGRLVWLPARAHSVWLAVSRAVRTPSRVEHDLILNIPPVGGVFPRVIRNEDFAAEKVIAYEIGYRASAGHRLFADLAVFYHDFHDLLSLEPGEEFVETEPPPSRRVRPLIIENGLHGESYGVEIAGDVRVLRNWWMSASYSYLQVALEPDAISRDRTQEITAEGSSPQHRAVLHSRWDFPWDVQSDALLRYVDSLPAQRVGSYLSLDLRLAKRLTRGLELSVVGQNLLEDHHREFAGGTEVERSAYAQLRWVW